MKKGRNSDMKKRRYTYLAGEDILLFKRRYTAFQKKIYCALAGSWMAGFLLMLLTATASKKKYAVAYSLSTINGLLTLTIHINKKVAIVPINVPAIDPYE